MSISLIGAFLIGMAFGAIGLVALVTVMNRWEGE